MRKIGLIGGTGPESTLVYYKELTGNVARETGKFPFMTIESLSVFDVVRFCDERDYAGLADYLLTGVRNLAAAGAEAAAFTGITVHVVFDEVARRSPIPIISMVDAARDYAAEKGCRRVALLGTRPTMSGTFFQDSFNARGIGVVVPTSAEQDLIHERISTELELGKVLPKTVGELKAIAGRLVREEGADAVVLGCTELPLAFEGVELPVPKLDVMRVHIGALERFILGYGK